MYQDIPAHVIRIYLHKGSASLAYAVLRRMPVALHRSPRRFLLWSEARRSPSQDLRSSIPQSGAASRSRAGGAIATALIGGSLGGLVGGGTAVVVTSLIKGSLLSCPTRGRGNCLSCRLSDFSSQ